MTTTPPTAAEADAWFAANNQPYAIANDSLQANPDGGFRSHIRLLGYTQNDGTQQFLTYQVGDPTADAYTATLARGLAAQYGGVVFRSYSFAWENPSVASVTDDAAEQDRISDPANWLAAP